MSWQRQIKIGKRPTHPLCPFEFWQALSDTGAIGETAELICLSTFGYLSG
jgi:hypothetical protein